MSRWGWRIALAVMIAYAALAIAAPLIAPYGESEIIGGVWQGPSAQHWLGTDGLGRDMLSRLLYGGRTTLGLAAASTAFAFVIGVGCGLAAAVMGSWIDMALSRLVDALMALPTLIIALIVLSVLGSSIPILIAVTAVLEATRFFRVARGAGLAVAAMDYVEVARLRGEGLLWLIRREVLINILGVIMTETALRFGFIILFISGLSFLGLGVQPPHADWGSMVRENAIALNFGRSAPLVPAIAIAGITIALNMLVGTTRVRQSSR